MRWAAAFWKARPARLLPGVSQALLGEPFATALASSWWCGEDAALVEALECLPQRVIKPTYPAASPRGHMEPVLASQLDAASLHALARAHPAPAGISPCETCRCRKRRSGGTATRRPPIMLCGCSPSPMPGGWQVMPGGLTRVADEPDQPVVSMQRGGSQPGHLGADAQAVDICFLYCPASCAPPTWRTSAGW